MASDFFDSNIYFIDEKVNFFKFENTYLIYNDKGKSIGAVKQKISTGHKMLSLLINKGMLPFLLEIKNNNDGVEATITRNWTFFLSQITIKNASGVVVGTIKQKFNFLKPIFLIFDASGKQIATIKGDWKAWEFTIYNMSNQPLGSISKKWAGAMKELFTSADKYVVQLNGDNIDNKIAILASAITIDMVLKESK